ncbi:beta-ketoadipate enol-lactone hydrolase [Halalkalibacter wakoensis JCM 9140]|uniref:Beta-ketoadipate enol-lactone hydrolase n=1 Tax=Halalkalibacter wakoensis JCM 9140 TaxID=1236970 RepID=W4PZU3_9BACI|nr:alpha/beta hydrolase [Halalkalibacter wakoensis]GAE25361.1 beta-ketoadipate enol-lactone hydrolase [Halalkalibacter wakoensis JCM 9140]
MLSYKTIEKSKGTDWVVLLHGLGGNSTVFYKQIDEYEKYFNLLLIDFPGHGDSQSFTREAHTVEKISEEIYSVIDKLSISAFHLVGFSLGTIIAQQMIAQAPDRIKSVVLAGAVVRWSWWSQELVKAVYSLRFFAPYMFFYKAFALIMMPKENHKRSRDIFIREAVKLGRQEFFKWAKLVLKPEYAYNNAVNTQNSIPKLIVMGEEDHMFIESATEAVSRDPFASIQLIKGAGHVCIIEEAKEFNNLSLLFLNEQSEAEKVGA